jgi:cytochrome c oxidase assembly protein subunit 15
MAVIANSTSTTIRDRRRDRAVIRGSLYIVALLIVAMIVVGGATRLSDSGLSITEWLAIHGVVPPLIADAWQVEFD